MVAITRGKSLYPIIRGADPFGTPIQSKRIIGVKMFGVATQCH